MLKYSWVIIYGIICGAAAVIKISKHNGKDKSVNLALETVFEFDNEDKKSDVNLLNKVQRFIGKVKNVIENNNAGRRQLSYDRKNMFSSFISDVIQILSQYDDSELENVVTIISEEMRNYNYPGCKFYEIAENIEQYKQFAKKLAEIRYKPAAKIKDDLKKIANKMYEKKFEKPEKELLETISSVYQEDSAGKFHNFLIDIDDYRKKTKENINITKVIRQGLKTILFDHYTNLTVHSRTALLSKLQNYIKFYNDNSVQKIPVVTKNTNKLALRTSSHTYGDKDEYIKHDSNSFEDQTTKSKISNEKPTPVSLRPRNVPTLTKSKSEYSNGLLHRHKIVKKGKRNRFIKVQRVTEEYPSSPNRKISIATTKEGRTLRQMYVEKNLDLKYDPDAYEHLTTTKKYKKLSSRPFKSPTTRRYTHKREKKLTKHKHKKQTTKEKYERKHKSEDNSDKSNIHSSNNAKSEETVLTDFIIDLSTEIKSTTKYKLTKMARFFGQTLLNKDSDYNNDVHPEYRSQNQAKKLTFKTLYPTFVIDWSTQPRLDKKQFGYTPEFKVRLPKQGNNEGSQLYTYKPGRPGEIKLVKNLDYSIEVKKPNNWELGLRPKIGYQNEHCHKSKSKKARARSHKTNKQISANIPVFQRKEKESGGSKLKMSRDPMILARQYKSPLQFSRKQFRRQFTQSPMISEEGLSIEGLKDGSHKVHYRRNYNPNTTDIIDSNVHVLRRLQNLENALEFVKTQLKTDTNLNNTLDTNTTRIINRPDVFNGENSNGTIINKITNSSNLIIGTNIDGVTKLKNINPEEANKIKISENLSRNNQSSDTNTENDAIKRKYDEYPHNDQSKTTKVDQGRKTLTNLEKIEEMQSDNDEINTKSKSKNNKPTTHVEDNSIESKIKEVNQEKYMDSKTSAIEKAFFFRNNEDIDKERNNLSEDEAMKDKYISKISQQNDTKSDNWVEVVYREREFNNKIDDQEKRNAIEDNMKAYAANIQSNNLNDLTSDGKVDNSGIAFRAVDMTTPEAKLTAESITSDGLMKANVATTEHGITINKTVSQTTTPKTSTLDSVQKKIVLIDKSADGNIEQKDKEEKTAEATNRTSLLSLRNEMLSQNNGNIPMASNLTADIESKV